MLSGQLVKTIERFHLGAQLLHDLVVRMHEVYPEIRRDEPLDFRVDDCLDEDGLHPDSRRTNA